MIIIYHDTSKYMTLNNTIVLQNNKSKKLRTKIKIKKLAFCRPIFLILFLFNSIIALTQEELKLQLVQTPMELYGGLHNKTSIGTEIAYTVKNLTGQKIEADIEIKVSQSSINHYFNDATFLTKNHLVAQTNNKKLYICIRDWYKKFEVNLSNLRKRDITDLCDGKRKRVVAPDQTNALQEFIQEINDKFKFAQNHGLIRSKCNFLKAGESNVIIEVKITANETISEVNIDFFGIKYKRSKKDPFDDKNKSPLVITTNNLGPYLVKDFKKNNNIKDLGSGSLDNGTIYALNSGEKQGHLEVHVSNENPLLLYYKSGNSNVQTSINELKKRIISGNKDNVSISKLDDNLYIIIPISIEQKIGTYCKFEVDTNGPFIVSNRRLREGPLWLNGVSDKKKALSCAHRGFFRKPGVPENTILAYEFAILEASKRETSLDILEVDIEATKEIRSQLHPQTNEDSEFVMFHDHGLSRTAAEKYNPPFHPSKSYYTKSSKDGSIGELGAKHVLDLNYRDNFWNEVPDNKIQKLETILKYFDYRQTNSAEESIKHILTEKYFNQIKNIHKELFDPNSKAVQRTANGIKVVLGLDKLDTKSIFLAYDLAKNLNNIKHWLLFKHRIILDNDKIKGWSLFEAKLKSNPEFVNDIIYSPIILDKTFGSGKHVHSCKKANKVIELLTQYEKDLGLLLPAYELFIFEKTFLKLMLDQQNKTGDGTIDKYFKPESNTYLNKWLGVTMLNPVNDFQFNRTVINTKLHANEIDNRNDNRYNDMTFNLKFYFNYFITDMIDYVIGFLVDFKLIEGK